MTTFNDVNGLTAIRGIKFDGASEWVGKSSSVAAMDVAATVPVFSFTNWSVNEAVMSSTEGTAATNAASITALYYHLAKKGIIDVMYNGTNKVS